MVRFFTVNLNRILESASIKDGMLLSKFDVASSVSPVRSLITFREAYSASGSAIMGGFCSGKLNAVGGSTEQSIRLHKY